MESAKYKLGGSNDQISGDGGPLATVYEKGSKLGLEPLDYGDSSLVGLWTMDEGAGSTSGVSTTTDASGNGNTGTWYGTGTGTSGYYSPGKVGPWAGYFNGSNDYIQIPSSSVFVYNNGFTFSLWLNLNNVSANEGIIGQSDLNSFYIDFQTDGGSKIRWETNVGQSFDSNYSFQTGQWYMLTGTYNFSSGFSSIYVNGNLDRQVSATAKSNFQNIPIKIGKYSSLYFPGLIDDVRIYNRALSAAEIQVLYNGGK